MVQKRLKHLKSLKTKIMKPTVILLAALLFSINIFAQVPDKISYQAIIRNSSGNLVRNHQIRMKISILSNSEAGTPVYTEIHDVESNENGLVSLEIGNGSTTDVFTAIDWSTGIYFLKTETDPDGNSNFSITGVSQILSVPYAFHAQTVENDQIDDADADPANELQSLSVSGNELTISHGNTIILPGDTTNIWKTEGENAYFNGGKVGIGTSTPAEDLVIHTGDAPISALALQTNASGNTTHDGFQMFINGANEGNIVNYENGKLNLGTSDRINMTIIPGGNIGIGTTSPDAALHVRSNNGVLFEGEFGSSNIPVEGSGARMMWYPGKAAFRTGLVSSTEWNDSVVGIFSTALGVNVTAKGAYSLAMGRNNNTNGESSVAIGAYSQSNGTASMAVGFLTEANGDYSTVLGYDSKAKGILSTAIGYNTISNGIGTTALGMYNIGGGTTNTWTSTDPLIEIGNGTENNRHNAMTILRNGNVGIGTGIVLDYNVRLTVEGDTNNYSLIKINQLGTKEYAGLSIQRENAEKWFLGMDRTTDNLQFRHAGSTNFMTITEAGNVGIGTTSPQGKLDVNGAIYQRGGSLHADYVFEDNYQLESIEEHAMFMWQNKHLPAIPKAAKDDNGDEIVEAGAHRKGIVEELEKAHIYISQLEQTINELTVRLEKLENMNEK